MSRLNRQTEITRALTALGHCPDDRRLRTEISEAREAEDRVMRRLVHSFGHVLRGLGSRDTLRRNPSSAS